MVAVLRLGLKQVQLGAHHYLGGGDQFLANRVDWRVGHLGKELLEIVVKQLRVVGQSRRRRVVAHGAQSLDPVGSHRRHQNAQLLKCVAENLLPLEHGSVVNTRYFRLRLGHLVQADQVLVKPLAVRMRAGHRLLELLVGNDAALRRIDQEHPARFQARLLEDALRLHRQYAHLRCHHHHVVFGDAVARGAQPVAVQHRTYNRSVGKDHGGRPVPRLHHCAVVLVESLLGVTHRFMLRPRLRDHHHHRVRQRPPG